MSRTRAYTRKMRAKAIKRKKRIVSNWHGFENGYYPHNGMYSKGMIASLAYPFLRCSGRIRTATSQPP